MTGSCDLIDLPLPLTTLRRRPALNRGLIPATSYISSTRARPVGQSRLSLVVLVAGLVILTALSAAPVRAATRPAPFTGLALWISRVPPVMPEELARIVVSSGVRSLYIKAGDGSTPDPQFTPALVRGLRAAGVSVCGWTFAYGTDPRAEAGVALSAVRAGAQCLVVDAEGQYDRRYGAAQVFVRAVRAHFGRGFPIGLAGQAEVAQHPTFPYSVFLGPGGFGFDLPQIYWRDLGLSVDAGYRATLGSNAVYGRPILPVGQLYGSPSSAAVARFRTLAAAYGCAGLSFFSLDAAQPAGLAALRGAVRRTSRRELVAATLRPGADGDQVVWAQELLNADGARLPVGGFFGAQTSRAVADFQTRHGLRPDGVLGPASWRVLTRQHAQEPSWAKAPPQSARG
jgi:putative peptidoglycan binding protein